MYECKFCGNIQKDNNYCNRCGNPAFNTIHHKMIDTIIAEQTKNYRRAQFDKLGDTQYIKYKTKVKFIKPDGETNWLDIESEELQTIIEVLT